MGKQVTVDEVLDVMGYTDPHLRRQAKRIAQKALRRYRAKPLPEYGRDEARELMSLAAHIATA